MQEPPPSDVAENAAVGGPETLSPEAIESVLGEFRTWLLHNPSPEPDTEAVTLDRVLEQFTALRHEVNLQTKAARAQLEQNGQTLQNLDEALDELRKTTAAEEELDRQAEEDHLRPLLKAVIEVHDNLLRAHRETQRVCESLKPLLTGSAEQGTELVHAPAEPMRKRSGWSRWFGSPQEDEVTTLRRQLAAEHQQLREVVQARATQVSQVVERIGRVLDGVATGYRMSLDRVETVLRQYGLEAIPAEGEYYDPERMEVLEAVSGSGRPNNEVLDEVRRGYLWHGRVFRYALVRVAKG